MLIYHDIDSKIDIVNRLTDCLAEGGYLVLGAGESLIGISCEFDQVIADQSVFYRKKSRASLAS